VPVPDVVLPLDVPAPTASVPVGRALEVPEAPLPAVPIVPEADVPVALEPELPPSPLSLLATPAAVLPSAPLLPLLMPVELQPARLRAIRPPISTLW